MTKQQHHASYILRPTAHIIHHASCITHKKSCISLPDDACIICIMHRVSYIMRYVSFTMHHASNDYFRQKKLCLTSPMVSEKLSKFKRSTCLSYFEAFELISIIGLLLTYDRRKFHSIWIIFILLSCHHLKIFHTEQIFI